MRKGRIGSKYKDWLFAYAFIAPLLVGVLIFTVIPIGQSFYYSFTKWNGIQTPEWNDFENYARLIGDTVFRKEFKNTVVYVFISVPVSLMLSLFIANLLNTKIRGLTVFRVIYFLPNVTMSVVVALIWTFMFNSQYGVVNDLLYKIFKIRPSWLTDPKLMMVVVIVVAVWSSIGYNMIILLAGLQNVPQSLYEAGELDGAGPFQKFLYITLPLVSPTVFFLSITSIINAFNAFDHVYMFASSAGPIRDGIRTMVYGIYETGFQFFEMGYASAKAVILFFIIMLITLIQFIAQKKWVHY